jgi:hypothetical protein
MISLGFLFCFLTKKALFPTTQGLRSKDQQEGMIIEDPMFFKKEQTLIVKDLCRHATKCILMYKK